MSENNSYTIGEVYYRITYPDPGRLYPGVQTFVFVGINLSEEDSCETWYFQFAEDYAKYGSVLHTANTECRVCCLTEHELSDMIDLSALTLALKEAAERRRIAAEPDQN